MLQTLNIDSSDVQSAMILNARDSRRRRRSPHSSLLKMSTFAFTVSSVVGFQNCGTSLSRTGSFSQLNYRKPTSHRVMIDPDHLLSMKIDERRIEALEDMYLLTSDDGLSGELVEIPPDIGNLSPRTDSLKSSESKVSRSDEVNTLNKTKDGTARISTRAAESMSSLQPSSSRKMSKPRSRSSTMPGLAEGRNSNRQRAFRESIKLVENRTGKKLSKIIDSPEAKRSRRSSNGEAMYKACASVPDSLVHFANEIHTVERITPAEETELGKKTQEAIRLQTLYDKLEKDLNRPPTDGEWCAAAGKINLEAITQAIEDGIEAKNKLVTSNLRMVQGVVNVYIRNGLGGQYNAGDLMQEGIMALIRAAEKFDPGRGFRFSTYAMYWIRSAVKRSQIYQSRIVSVPQRLYENHKRICRVEKQLKQQLERPPTKAEIGEVIGMSEDQVEKCIKAMSQRCYSLDQNVINTKKPGDKNDMTMYELVENQTEDGGYNEVNHLFFREDLVRTICRHLTEDEANLLLLRYGLIGGPNLHSGKPSGPLTIAEVSSLVGWKPDKVRRILNKSLKQLKAIIGSEWVEYERDLL